MERMTYRERRERRAARREEWAKGRKAKAERARRGARQIAEGIPFGQPILVGHHSEKRARRDADRITRGYQKSAEHSAMADRHETAAATIRGQLETSVYDDDHDAIQRLQERIDEREAQRDRIKLVNRVAAKVARKHGIRKRKGHWLHTMTEAEAENIRAVLVEICGEVNATKREISDMASGLTMNGTLGFPSYMLSNLGGKISRDRKRLERLKRERAGEEASDDG